MKIESNKVAAASLLIAAASLFMLGLASGISPACAQVIAPRAAAAGEPMSITVPFVVAAAKVRPAKQPYTLIVEAPVGRDTAERPLPAPVFPQR